MIQKEIHWVGGMETAAFWKVRFFMFLEEARRNITERMRNIHELLLHCSQLFYVKGILLDSMGLETF